MSPFWTTRNAILFSIFLTEKPGLSTVRQPSSALTPEVSSGCTDRR